MAILKDLIVHGSSRFLNKIYASEIQTPLIEAEAGIIKKLKADDVTVVGLLDVQGQLHTNSWTNSNIATIDGSFYITPTIECASGTLSSLTINTDTPPKHSFVLTAATGNSFAVVNSLYYYDTSAHTVTWAKYSKVLITGEILVGGEWIPLGTILGQLNANGASASISIFNGQNNKHGTSTILAELTSANITSAEFRNLKISLYQRSGSTSTNTDAYKYPLGIYLTALGQNGKTFIDIYGGVNALTTSYGGYANPNVRIGNLSGLPAITTAAGNFTPVGWGIYTTNGYFSGTIVSNTGVIGGWKLGANSLYNETTGLNDNTVGIYLGTDGIRNYSTSTQYVNITGGKIKAQGVDLTGKITASSGSIGGWNIGTDTNKSLCYGNQTPGATTTNLILSPTSATNSNAIGGSGTGLKWFISAGKVFGVTTAGALYAISGKIGGWTIGASSLYNSKSSYNNSNEGLYLGTDYIAGGAGEEWWFRKDGSAKIGEMTLTKEGVLSVPAARISGELTAATIDASKISTGDISSDRITTNVLTALQAKLTSLNTNNLSAITANLGTITAGVIKHDTVGSTNGIWLSADTDTSSNITVGESTARKDWRLLVNNKFGVTKTGDLYASSANISGTITATEGTIGGINIVNGALDVSSINIGSLSGEIGGRNLIINTLNPDSTATNRPKFFGQTVNTIGRGIASAAEHGIRFTTTSNAYCYMYMGFTAIEGTGATLQGLTIGETYTFSCDFTCKLMSNDTSSTEVRYFRFYPINDSTGTFTTSEYGDMIALAQIDKGVEKSNRFEYTFTIPEGTTKFGFMFRTATTTNSLYATGDFIEFKNMKLEKGNKATDWTPAPEDIEDAKKVATNYLSVDSTGIMIANMEDGEQTPSAATGKNVFIDNDSVAIRDGLNVSASFESDNITFYNADSDYNEEIASFGTRGARIGKDNQQHFLVNAESLQAINESGSSIFSISSTNATMNSIIKVANGIDCVWQEETITLEDASYTDETFFIGKILLTIEYPDSDVRPIYNTLAHSTDFLLKSWSKKKLSIEFPQISFTYGTSDSAQYTITFNSTFLNGPFYTYTGSLTVSYDGDRTFTFHPYNGNWVCESDPTYSGSHTPSYPVSYNVPYIMTHGTSKAPSMTFGTREVNNEIAPFSTTIGEGLYANSDNQLSIGKYNLNNDPLTNPFMFVIGNGQNNDNRSNALEVDQYGNLNVNGNMRCNSNYLVATKSYYWNNTVGANSAWAVNDYDVTIPGYTAVGVVSFGLHNQESGGRNADWCVVPRCILWGGSTQNLEFYVWNQHTSQSAIVSMMVKILYVPSNIFGALS